LSFELLGSERTTAVLISVICVGDFLARGKLKKMLVKFWLN